MKLLCSLRISSLAVLLILLPALLDVLSATLPLNRGYTLPHSLCLTELNVFGLALLNLKVVQGLVRSHNI